MVTTYSSFQVPIGIPIFGLGFTKDNQLLLCGGGGAGRSGVKNKLCYYKMDMKRKEVNEKAIYEISSDEDAPMCLAIHPKENVAASGINTSLKSMMNGINDNCRLFDIGETSILRKNAVKSLDSTKEDDYQKAVRFSKDGSLLATATTDGLASVYTYPSLDMVAKVQVVENNDVLDVDINDDGSKLTAVVPDALKLISLRGQDSGTIIQTVSSAAVSKHKLQFRAFRYGNGITENLAFAAANGIGKSNGGFIVILDAHTLEIKKVHQVSKKPITTFCLSPDGTVIGYGSADFGISLLEASTLRVLTEMKNAHGFSITSMAISPDRRILVSGSADNTCRVVELPIQFPPASLNPLHTILLAIAVTGVLVLLITYYTSFGLRNKEDGTVSVLPMPTTKNNIVDYTPIPSTLQTVSAFTGDEDDDLDGTVSILPIPTTENNIIDDDTLSSIQATATLPDDDFEPPMPTTPIDQDTTLPILPTPEATIIVKEEL